MYYFLHLPGRVCTVTVVASFGHWVEPESHLKISQKKGKKNFRSHPFIHEGPTADEWTENNAQQLASDD